MPEDHFGERSGTVRRAVCPQGSPCRRRPHRRLPRRPGRRGRSARARHRTGRIALPLARRGGPGARDRPLRSDGRATASQTRRRADRRHDRRFRYDHRRQGTFSVAYLVANTIMNLTTQDEQVACFQRLRAPRAGRLLRDRGARPGAAAASARRDVPPLRREPGAPRVRRVRRGSTGPRLASLLGRRRQGRGLLAPVPLRLAVGARPDGAARRDDAARALERLAARALHEREHQARLRLEEAA